ncbi:hypothetical protein EJ110_NYTH21190 [Nymphaea thermarum]|nr:hypothetical protein EJ110_NYTH21190 [Nymphaea thermarum]
MHPDLLFALVGVERDLKVDKKTPAAIPCLHHAVLPSAKCRREKKRDLTEKSREILSLRKKNAFLLEPATYAEVKEAVMSLDKDSALGPAGFLNFFYQIMWEEIGQEIWREVDNFFKSEKLVRNLNKTYLMLIPKKRGARRIEDFRPIALCNSLYKVIVEVMVQRMKNILPRLIGITQGAFVKSRVIHDQIAMANELVHLFDSRKEAVACLKLDISKAYDRVSWRFMHNSLLYLGFHPSRGETSQLRGLLGKVI